MLNNIYVNCYSDDSDKLQYYYYYFDDDEEEKKNNSNDTNKVQSESAPVA